MSTCCSLLPDVETAAFVNSKTAGTFAIEASTECTRIRQPRRPGARR